ncbi:unnamed protein product [Alternaria alternata]
MTSNGSNGGDQLMELVKNDYLTPITTTLNNPDVGDLPEEVAIFGCFLKDFQLVIDSRKVRLPSTPDEVRKNMSSHLSWFLQYLRNRQKNAAPSPAQFASSVTYFYEFARGSTTASPEEIERLRQTYERLSKDHKDEPQPVYTQRNFVSGNATSYQFIATRQTNNTGNGLQIDGNVQNLHFYGDRNQS